jgi:hypothetical protein
MYAFALPNFQNIPRDWSPPRGHAADIGEHVPLAMIVASKSVTLPPTLAAIYVFSCFIF